MQPFASAHVVGCAVSFPLPGTECATGWGRRRWSQGSAATHEVAVTVSCAPRRLIQPLQRQGLTPRAVLRQQSRHSLSSYSLPPLAFVLVAFLLLACFPLAFLPFGVLELSIAARVCAAMSNSRASAASRFKSFCGIQLFMISIYLAITSRCRSATGRPAREASYSWRSRVIQRVRCAFELMVVNGPVQNEG